MELIGNTTSMVQNQSYGLPTGSIISLGFAAFIIYFLFRISGVAFHYLKSQAEKKNYDAFCDRLIKNNEMKSKGIDIEKSIKEDKNINRVLMSSIIEKQIKKDNGGDE